MTSDMLATLIAVAGAGHLPVLLAAALVPARLEWRAELERLPRLLRQMHWVYGGYIVLAIVAFAAASLLLPHELASGSALARAVCGYVAVFWGVRLVLQFVLEVRAQLTTWWLRLGYHGLTVLFAGFTAVYGYAAVR